MVIVVGSVLCVSADSDEEDEEAEEDEEDEEEEEEAEEEEEEGGEEREGDEEDPENGRITGLVSAVPLPFSAVLEEGLGAASSPRLLSNPNEYPSDEGIIPAVSVELEEVGLRGPPCCLSGGGLLALNTGYGSSRIPGQMISTASCGRTNCNPSPRLPSLRVVAELTTLSRRPPPLSTSKVCPGVRFIA